MFAYLADVFSVYQAPIGSNDFYSDNKYLSLVINNKKLACTNYDLAFKVYLYAYCLCVLFVKWYAYIIVGVLLGIHCINAKSNMSKIFHIVSSKPYLGINLKIRFTDSFLLLNGEFKRHKIYR